MSSDQYLGYIHNGNYPSLSKKKKKKKKNHIGGKTTNGHS